MRCVGWFDGGTADDDKKRGHGDYGDSGGGGSGGDGGGGTEFDARFRIDAPGRAQPGEDLGRVVLEEETVLQRVRGRDLERVGHARAATSGRKVRRDYIIEVALGGRTEMDELLPSE